MRIRPALSLAFVLLQQMTFTTLGWTQQTQKSPSISPQPSIASPILGLKPSNLRDSFNEIHNGHRHEGDWHYGAQEYYRKRRGQRNDSEAVLQQGRGESLSMNSMSRANLHFAIYVLGPQKSWWEGVPIDPYPILERSLSANDARRAIPH